MTSTASPRVGPPAARRSGSISHSPSSITRGATARSAASPRVSSPVTRRPAARGPASPVPNGDGDSASLKEATEKIESLLVQLQNKEQTISNITTENDQLNSAIHAAETRMNEFYAEQSRSEMELSQRIEISEKLRTQVRELEKEKRDLQRRYNEQTTTFDAERQTFYDNEQHLKSRIQTLSQARKQTEIPRASAPEPETDGEEEAEEELPTPIQATTQDMNDPEQEPAEMTALRLELSTLSTSYASVQNTLVLLQTQLVDLKRVNQQLQEENESYTILLQQKTLRGRVDLEFFRQQSDDDDEEEERGDAGSLRSTGRSTLDRVEEEQSETLGETLGQELERSVADLGDNDDSSQNRSRQGRTRSPADSPKRTKGESLADLPITGPGLDLAAELGRAENHAILTGEVEDSVQTSPRKKKNRGKSGIEASVSASDITALRSEVKALKDANKALSLYASKIIDRIISQEGFEHVLAADYDSQPTTPATAAPPEKKPRPKSVQVERTSGAPPFDFSKSPSPAFPAVPKLGAPPETTKKAQRRSLSFDWKGFSIFNNSEKKPDPSLRPLTLKPGANPVTGARKLDTEEDEADRRERERIQATMKLLGIETPAPGPPPPIQKSFSSPGPTPAPTSPVVPPPSASRRFSFFGTRTPSSNTDANSGRSTPASNAGSGVGLGIELTEEAVAAAEAQNNLAALDAQEKLLSAEIAKGSSTGFTEIQRRQRRGPGSRKSGGSGSTVWSAGIEEE
ncbi:hypothetical protein D9758_000161 [Tetrapyrgos nigripes]|uniref:Uncharacterized protein n=1 Tax=Tetrapyrgos nigripes TaxID=182062 RepID=A0A8H5H0L7_9AGAR|nr:hypothetical protein D9758_000161 [Tetrapyrgos nigripes]